MAPRCGRGGRYVSMPFLVYVRRKIEATLPWWEDTNLSRH
jgi:hypothetical protein